MSAQSTGSGWFVAGLLFVNILIAITGMNALAPLFPEVSTEIALSMAQMGTAIGVFNLASPIFTPIGGAIADRFGCRWTLGVTTMILGVGACMRFFADTPGELIAYMFLLGVGFAPYGPLVPKALSGYFPPEELGKANGVVFSSFGLGGALALGTAASFMSPRLRRLASDHDGARACSVWPAASRGWCCIVILPNKPRPKPPVACLIISN